MDYKDIFKIEKEIEKLNIIKSENIFMNIKSIYIMKKIFNILNNINLYNYSILRIFD